MGIGDDFLDDAVLPPRIDVRDPIAERVGGQELVCVVQFAFVVEESLAVGDQVLQIADLRPIDGRIINLIENTLGNGEPHATQGGVGGAYTVLVAASPAGFDPRTTGSRIGIQ